MSAKHDWREHRTRWTVQYRCRRCGTIDTPWRMLKAALRMDRCRPRDWKKIRRDAYVVKP